jgi:hypothetical protein
MVGADLRIAYANPAARRLFAITQGTLEGSGVERLVVAERKGELRNIEEVLKGGSARRVRSVLRREDGGRVDVTMMVEPCLDALGRVEAATIRYEVIAGSGRMSSAPDLMADPRSLPPLRNSLNSPSFSGVGSVEVREQEFEASVESRGFAREQQVVTRTAPASPSSEIEARLNQVIHQLDWLEDRLNKPASEASLDDARERARALLAVSDAREQLRQAFEEVRSGLASVPPLPAPPKLPTL